MKLYLVRHGAAVDIAATETATDARRPLTANGRERAGLAARGFASLGLPVTRVVSSPLVRALETAGIFAGALALQNIEILDDLGSGGDHRAVVNWLAGQPSGDAIMMVGHMPDLVELTSLLVCGRHEIALQFKKCSVCCLVLEDGVLPGTARLEAFFPPGVLRQLADK